MRKFGTEAWLELRWQRWKHPRRDFYPCGLGYISMPSQTSVLLVWGCAVVSRICRWAALETWDVAQKGAFLLSFLPSSTSGQVLILAIRFSLFTPLILITEILWSFCFFPLCWLVAVPSPKDPMPIFLKVVMVLFSAAPLVRHSWWNLYCSSLAFTWLWACIFPSFPSCLLCLRASTNLRTWSSQHSHFFPFPY